MAGQAGVTRAVHSRPPPLTADLLLHGYRCGIFPMADSRDASDVFWLDLSRRGILPLDGFHVSRSLARSFARGGFEIAIDRDFDGVVAGCAERPETWINAEIFRLYGALHRRGAAHSVEVWAAGRLVGGVYGVTLGAAFFGESMFSRTRDASKFALVALIARLRSGGFTLFDTQFVTDHLVRLGAIEIERAEYHARLGDALARPANFFALGRDADRQTMLQVTTQTS